VYNSNSNFIADNTKPQSNYMNIRGNKPWCNHQVE
jgi:hypothetical protein